MRKLLVGLVLGLVASQMVFSAPTATMTLSPSSGLPPYEATLLWSSAEVKTCQAGDGWSGAKATSGSVKVTITAVVKFSLVCSAQGVNKLSWSPPTTRADGTLLTNLAGYKIYRGTEQSVLPLAVTINNPGTVSYDHAGLAAGTYWYAMTAFDSAGLESDFSPKLSIVTSVANVSASVTAAIESKPSPPGGFKVTTSIGVE